MQEKEQKFKYFTLVLYPDENEKDLAILNYLKNTYTYKLCIHDKDDCKIHTHIVFVVPSPRTLSSIKKELDVTYIENVRTIKSMILYLTHQNEDNKHHYDITELVGDLEISDESNELFDVNLILQFISNYGDYLYISSINWYCIENGLWSAYRRNQNIIIMTMKEHNEYINRERKENLYARNRISK